MLVQRVLMPDTSLESWTVLDGDGPLEPVDRWLAHLTAIERSPNTVKAYAHDLKDWFVFLQRRGLDWREIRLEDLGEFVAWLRLPPEVRDGRVAVLPSVEHHCTETSVNRKLSALSSFYAHAARHGVDLGELLVTWQPARRHNTAWKPFLHHISKHQPQPQRTVKLTAPRKLPQILTAAQVQAILDGCEHLRDRLLFAVLWDAGVRIGEALGLRHEDLAVPERELTITRRVNDNGARAKSATSRTIPVSTELMQLYARYLNEEYRDLDSDYVFVNLWSGRHGHPWTYASVYDLVKRLRRQLGFAFDPHWARHGFATRSLRTGTPLEVVSKLLGHASVTTTSEIYGHLTVEDARKTLEAAGWFTGNEVTW